MNILYGKRENIIHLLAAGPSTVQLSRDGHDGLVVVVDNPTGPQTKIVIGAL